MPPNARRAHPAHGTLPRSETAAHLPPVLLRFTRHGPLDDSAAFLTPPHVLNFLHCGPRYYPGALRLTQPLLHVDFVLPVFWSLCYEAVFYLIVALLLLPYGLVRPRACSTPARS